MSGRGRVFARLAVGALFAAAIAGQAARAIASTDDDRAAGKEAPAKPGPPPPPLINDAVLEYARAQVGKSVNDGECTSLVHEALNAAGAKRFPPYGREADYVWGAIVESRTQVRPGDIVQFRDVVFRGRKTVTDAAGNTTVVFYRTTFDHHSAIVESVRDRGRVIEILHQNAGPADTPEAERKLVQRGELRMADRRPGEGRLWFYRPVPEPSDEGQEPHLQGGQHPTPPSP